MHGRLKVRTSAEEAARKKKEQEQKVVAYRAGMGKIFAKRTANEYDQEMLEVTGKVLCANPDIYTLWNIRKECILKMTENDSENSNIFDKDLSFTENCLFVQPKSYGAWHHRCWILEKSPEPNWKREVDLCTKYLKLDERNFHCWDYRRFVIEKAEIEAQHELKFCTEKIQNNFSNYSSWHYRSKLLPVLYPHNDETRPICEEKLTEELDLVLTAAFTDPNDSSAWFYQRWLLGYSEPDLGIATFQISEKKAIITFTKPIDLNNSKYKIKLDCFHELENCSWKPIINNDQHSSMWQTEEIKSFKLNNTNSVEIKFFDESNIHKLILSEKDDSLIGIAMPKFGYIFGKGIIDQLKEQLESCNQLLEYEPDSKWTLLTAALLMRAIDRKNFHKQVIEYLEKLEKVDSLRKGYYKDLVSKWNIEERLEHWINSKDFEAGINLSELKLSNIYYEQYMSLAKKINLSDNDLTDCNLFKFLAFQNCKTLNLCNNRITSSSALSLLKNIENIIIN